MARSTPAGEGWGAWLNTHLGRRGWRQIDLINASGDRLVPQTVSKWVKGQYAPDPNTVVIVAETLRVPLPDALRAAGYDTVADAMEKDASGQPDNQAEPIDDVERLILARKGLTPERKAEELARYRRRMARVMADTVDIIEAIAEPDDEARSA
jgi:succinate dehydrogenase/fumarate reductase flavoprotein subunit